VLAAAQSSRLAEFGGLGMSFNTCRGTLWQLGNVHRDKERLVARQQIGSSAVFHNAKCRYWPIASFRCGAAIRSFWNEADIGLSFMS